MGLSLNPCKKQNTMDIPKLRQEKEILKFELNILKKQSSIVIDEIVLREKLLENFKVDAKNIQDKIQELAEKIDYYFLENTKIKCHCSEDNREDCYANCDYGSKKTES